MIPIDEPAESVKPVARIRSPQWLANRIIMITFILVVTLLPFPALATQEHGDPEGLYSHQMAHVFFAFSMGLLIYWLRKRRLVNQKGWRYIQFAAIFLIVWNADAFLIHWMDEQTELIRTLRIGLMEIHITTPAGYQWLKPIYYVAKLDHLLCVPALIFLFLGLRRLYKDQLISENSGDTAA